MNKDIKVVLFGLDAFLINLQYQWLMKFNEIFHNPVLINLDKRQDRLDRFDQQAKKLNIDYRRFQAVEATNPVLGCRLSHIAALATCKDPVAFVFEDDCEFIDGFLEAFEQAMAVVPDDWDMLYFGAYLLQKEPVNEHWARSLECSSTHAYAVKASLIPRLIKATMEYDGHIDVAFSGLHKDIKAYVARPTLIYQGANFSDLQGVEVDYTYLYF